MTDLLKRYLLENYPKNSMLFLPNFKVTKVEKPIPQIPKSVPELSIPVLKKLPPPPPVAKPIAHALTPEKPKEVIPKNSSKSLSLLRQVAPHIFIHQDPLRDDKAKEVKTRFLLPKVPLLYTKDLEAYKPFLQNIAKAVETLTGSCRLVEVERIEEQSIFSYPLIIAPDVTIFASPSLIRHFKEIPASKERWLQDTPLLLLSDLALYMKNPNLKQRLWLEIKQACTRQSFSIDR